MALSKKTHLWKVELLSNSLSEKQQKQMNWKMLVEKISLG